MSIVSFVLSVVLSVAAVSGPVLAMDNTKPNIVFIMADDLGGRDLPVYGNRFNEAPHIDQLAKQGVLFHNAYAVPVCSATRASIQSGQYPARVGIFDFIPGHWRSYEEVTVPALTENEFEPECEVFTHYPVCHHEQPISAFRKGDWKIVENLVSGEFDLYNLKYDVNEITDLKFSYQQKAGEMKKALEKWQASTQAQMPVANPDFDSKKRYEWEMHPDR